MGILQIILLASVIGVAVLFVLLFLLGLAALGVLRFTCRRKAAKSDVTKAVNGKETIGFFHPYAHAGGGGERVLWCTIHSVQQRHPGVVCVVYTGDVTVTKGKFLELARDRFGVELNPDNIEFAFLYKRHRVDAAEWPRLTLLCQSLGSLALGYEALCCFCPDVMIDSMGYAFTLPLFALVGDCRLGCYVHYPTISTDMLAKVQAQEISVCNNADIARSRLLSYAKVVYYKAFAVAYGFVGEFAEIVMVNSSWTRGHIDSIWNLPERTSIVYPPCDTTALANLSLTRAMPPDGGFLVLSLAQFRPEKDHALQLYALARFYEIAPQYRNQGGSRVRLILAGGCRDDGDQERVKTLQELCVELGLREKVAESKRKDWDVAFRTNISVSEMHKLLGQATVGLHTMKEEHFGISVVEFMAAGAVPLAHKSGGPLMDIVRPLGTQRTGFLASDKDTYAASLKEIFSLSSDERKRIAAAAREVAKGRFAQEIFEAKIADRLVAPLRPKIVD